ncbi:hypothetical protein F4680DRAFT_417384 [Xylaria scruposa]|nr:hypothetical protein F4680DRAFT_417384 [Xylaria scruposa]
MLLRSNSARFALLMMFLILCVVRLVNNALRTLGDQPRNRLRQMFVESYKVFSYFLLHTRDRIRHEEAIDEISEGLKLRHAHDLTRSWRNIVENTNNNIADDIHAENMFTNSHPFPAFAEK